VVRTGQFPIGVGKRSRPHAEGDVRKQSGEAIAGGRSAIGGARRSLARRRRLLADPPGDPSGVGRGSVWVGAPGGGPAPETGGELHDMPVECEGSVLVGIVHGASNGRDELGQVRVVGQPFVRGHAWRS
jgi:hypothetical protein